jgi:hypothetical protein
MKPQIAGLVSDALATFYQLQEKTRLKMSGSGRLLGFGRPNGLQRNQSWLLWLPRPPHLKLLPPQFAEALPTESVAFDHYNIGF